MIIGGAGTTTPEHLQEDSIQELSVVIEEPVATYEEQEVLIIGGEGTTTPTSNVFSEDGTSSSQTSGRCWSSLLRP